MSEIRVKDTRNVKKIKDVVSKLQLTSTSVSVSKTGSEFVIRTPLDQETLRTHLSAYSGEFLLEKWTGAHKKTPTLESITKSYLQNQLGLSPAVCSELGADLPKKWSVYPPMVLFGAGAYESSAWRKIIAGNDMSGYFNAISPLFQGNVTHFAVNKPIVEEDVMRRPFNLIALHGDFGPETTLQTYSCPSDNDLRSGFWCSTVQNKIYQTWAPRYTMFSRGNIREKTRLLQYKNLDGLMAVDLYAGIGYFSLSYLANGATLFCWEINRWSVEGFIRGLAKNKHKYRLILPSETVSRDEILDDIKDGVRAFVFFESNANAASRLSSLHSPPIAHINLGLLPTLRPSWPIANKLAERSAIDTMVHVHENVHCDCFEALTEEVSEVFDGPAALEKVKTFAPDVWHVVVDCTVRAKN